jgi:AraC-like DNA-binding protein
VNVAHTESLATAGQGPRRKLERGSIGEMSLSEVCVDAQTVRQSRAHMAQPKDAMFFLHLQLEGESISRQDGRESVLRAGDFTLCDGTRRYEIAFTGANRMLVLGIPNVLLRRQIGCPESLSAIPMPGGRGASGLLSQLLRKYWSEYALGLEDYSGARIAVAILDLIGAAYANLPQAQGDRSCLGTAHRIRIINYIECHLNDPELTPTRIAEACKITARYLHHLFSDQDETVARYILRRRLEACSTALQSGAQRGRTVTAIAFDHGFNSPTHFGRVFRAKYHVTPREYRRVLANAQTGR